jgi:hypothetical protein
MANTVILLKRAANSGAVPTGLANGELGLDYWTGNLWFKAANGSYKLVNPSGGSQSPDFGTVNVNGTLLVSGVQGDVLSLRNGKGISATGVSGNDTIILASLETKAIAIPSPAATDNVSLFFTDTDITVRKIVSVLQGIANSNVVFTIKSASQRSNATPKLMNTAGFICANTAEGVQITTFDQPTINANSWVWLTTSFANGGTTELAVTISY